MDYIGKYLLKKQTNINNNLPLHILYYLLALFIVGDHSNMLSSGYGMPSTTRI